MIFLLFLIPNPRRGQSEAAEDVVREEETNKTRSYMDDLKYILTKWVCFFHDFFYLPLIM